MKTTTLKCLKWVWKRKFLDLRLTGLVTLVSLLAAFNTHATVVTTVGGGPTQSNSKYYGYADGNTKQASQFNFPSGVAVDPSGTILFIADHTNNAVRFITLPGESDSSYTATFAGATNGISRPVSVLVDTQTNVYVLNQGNGNNGTLLKFSALYINYQGVPPIFLATNAFKLTNATAMALDGLTNLYVTVKSNTVIKISPSNTVSIVGVITNAGTSLRGIAMLDDGQLALTDAGNHGIWVMNPNAGTLTNNATKLTGFHGPGDTNGPPLFAAFNRPEMISKAGNGVLVVADRGNHKVKLVDAASGTVSRLYGVKSSLWVQGSPSQGIFPGWWDGTVNPNETLSGSVEAREPLGVFVAQDGSVYTTEVYYHLIRHVTDTGLSSPGPLVIPPGPGSSLSSLFNNPLGIALDNGGGNLYIADQTNDAIQVLSFANNQTTTLLTSGNGISRPASVLVDSDNNILVLNQGTNSNGSLLKFDVFGNLLGTIAAGLVKPTALTLDGAGNIFVTELNGDVQVFNSGGLSNTVATVTNAGVQLQGIAIFDDGIIAVSDAGNHVIRLINPMTKAVTLLTGSPGVPGNTFGGTNAAKLNQPHQLTRAANNQLLVADFGNNRITVVQRSGSITNVFNTTNSVVWFGKTGDPYGTNSTKFVPMISPVGVALSGAGTIYASEVASNDIRGISPTSLTPPASLPVVTLPYFNSPQGIALDNSGSVLFIADQNNDAVQVLSFGDNSTFQYLGAADGLDRPVAVTVDPYDELFVLNQGTGGVGYITVYDFYGNFLGGLNGLTQPTALTLDGAGNVFVAEQGGAVKYYDFNAGMFKTLATVTNAGVQLQGIAIFDDGAVAVSDAGNHVIWQINAITKVITKLTGQLGLSGTTQGSAAFARLNQPHQLARAANNQLITADFGNNRVVTVSRTGSITNVLKSTNSTVWFALPGDPVAANNARWVPMASPVGVALNAAGEVYTSETLNNNIRGINATGLAQPLPAPVDVLPYFDSPRGIAVDNGSSRLYVADQANNAIRLLDLGNNVTTLFLDQIQGINQPSAVAVDTDNNLLVLNQGTGGNGNILKFDPYGNFMGTLVSGLASPTAMTVDFGGNIYVAELNGMVQKFNGGTSNTVATITTNGAVQLQGISLFDDGTVAVSDAGNHVIWQINPVTAEVTRLAGFIGVPGNTLGSSTFAKLNSPRQLAKAAGNQIIIADGGNNRLAVVSRSGSVTNILITTNSVVWFGLPGDPISSSGAQWVPMTLPFGVAIGAGGNVFSSEDFYNNIRKTTSGLSQPTPPSPAPDPQIGWVDYTLPPTVVSILRAGDSFIFNNDVTIAILGTGDSQVFYTYGPTPLAANIPDPTSTNGTTAPFYQDGVYPGSVPSSIISPQPDVTIKAVGVNPGSPNSAVVQTRFQFITANPSISGDNGAQFTLTDATLGASMYYTTDGTDPVAGAPSTGPVVSGTTLSLNVTSNLTFKVRAFKNNYQSSSVVTKNFTADGFVPNRISFGFVAGEASSDFVASPGQIFYAPVTLNVLPQQTIYSLQFNLTVTNINLSPALLPLFGFQSFLEKPIPGVNPPLYETIPPAMFLSYVSNQVVVTNIVGTNVVISTNLVLNPPSNPPPTNQIIYPFYEAPSAPYLDLRFIDSSINLLGVGWLERAGQKNLYDTTAQDLIKYSQAHDTLFDENGGQVILGGYAFLVPPTAEPGDQYKIQIGRPTATADGIGTPGSSVYIETPTNGSLSAGAINSIKIVSIGQRKYIAGDCAPFRWFNAGDFGNTNLENADVEQVFQSAIYTLNYPPLGSDFFDSMDSCGGFYIDNGNGYLEFDSYVSGTNALNALFSGDDSTINQIAFGDGKLDVCDVYVTFRRSLDPSLTLFRRFWTNGFLAAEATANNFQPLSVQKAAVPSTSVSITNQPGVNYIAGVAQGSAGQSVQIPITAQIFGGYPIRVLMMNLSVDPLDGSPALTSQVQFTPSTKLGAPSITASDAVNNYAAVWLNSTIAGLSNNATIGTLTITIPNGASANAAYAVHFDHISGSPNGLAALPKTTLNGLVTLSSQTNSTYGDGIPDSWRLRYFGTVNNLLSQAGADADGDGMNNMQEYIAGTDPLDAHSNLHVSNGKGGAQANDCAIHWPSVFGKKYVIERSADLFAPVWSMVSTNTGTGTEMEIHDSTGGNVRFYRVRVIP